MSWFVITNRAAARIKTFIFKVLTLQKPFTDVRILNIDKMFIKCGKNLNGVRKLEFLLKKKSLIQVFLDYFGIKKLS